MGGRRIKQKSEMGLHTQQQSLIFGELMSTRKKLEEENQQLRQELDDAQIMIRLLRLKLSAQKKGGSLTSEDTTAKASSRFFGGSNSDIPKERKSRSRKDSFKNHLAPGRKTFNLKNIDRIIDVSKAFVAGEKVSRKKKMAEKKKQSGLPPRPRARSFSPLRGRRKMDPPAAGDNTGLRHTVIVLDDTSRSTESMVSELEPPSALISIPVRERYSRNTISMDTGEVYYD